MENNDSNKTLEDNENKELIIEAIKARQDLEIANKNFDFSNSELTDYYSYQIKALKERYDYLLKKIKEKGIMLNVVDDIDLKYNKLAI